MISKRKLASTPAEAALPVRNSGRVRLHWLLVVKIATSTILLAWILNRASAAEIVAAIRSASLPILLAAYAVTFIGTMMSISRWRLLLQAQGATLPRLSLLRSYLVAMFFNNFLPSTVGGDASRAYDCYRMTGGNRGAMSSVVVDRLLGLLALALLAVVSLHFATPLSDHLPVLPVWLSLFAIGLAGVIGAIFFGLPSRPLGRLPGLLPGFLNRGIGSIAGAFGLYRGQWRTLLLAFALSLLLQINVVIYFILVAHALALDLPAVDFCLIVPLVSFVAMLPISINGVGLRENTLAVMLGYYGIAPAEAVALAWLVYLGSLLFAAVGGVIYAYRR